MVVFGVQILTVRKFLRMVWAEGETMFGGNVYKTKLCTRAPMPWDADPYAESIAYARSKKP